jgi:glycosyltransferase involved in cell wall biosynthesis
MLIYFVTESYPDKDFPSLHIFVYEQAKELALRGHNIVVLHVKKLSSRRIFEKIDSDIRICDDGFAIRYVKVQKTFLGKNLHKLNRRFYTRNIIQLFEKAVNDVGCPDVIYAHFSCFAGYAASILSMKYEIPLVTIEHYGGLLGQTISKTYKESIKCAIKQSKAFLCVSTGLKEAISRHVDINKELIVVSNMIDRRFKYLAPIKHDRFIFLGIGNLYKTKGFELLIRAFCNAFSVDEKVELRIGGSGPEWRTLNQMVIKQNRMIQIKLLGNLTREQTIEEYVNCNCFVLPSQHETFGMVYREALITGRPIITTDHGGFSGTDWHNTYGYKINIDAEDELIVALKEMRKNIDNFDTKKISKTCELNCSAVIVGNKIENILFGAIR